MLTLKMDAFETYRHYLALKSHFTLKTYDFFKYNGKVKASRDMFETRKDKFFFHKLSKHKDLTNFLVSIFVYGKKDLWIGDLVRNEESEQMYTEWQKVRQSLTYTFTHDLDLLNADLLSSFVSVDGQHPHALKLLMRKEIHLETFIILNDILHFVPSWNRDIVENIIWPEIRLKCKKYHPFLEYDQQKLKQIAVDKFNLIV